MIADISSTTAVVVHDGPTRSTGYAVAMEPKHAPATDIEVGPPCGGPPVEGHAKVPSVLARMTGQAPYGAIRAAT